MSGPSRVLPQGSSSSRVLPQELLLRNDSKDRRNNSSKKKLDSSFIYFSTVFTNELNALIYSGEGLTY